jgi:hypothetical protein
MRALRLLRVVRRYRGRAMTSDAIVEEVHRLREETAKRFGNDLHAICEDARRRQEASRRIARRLPPRPAKPRPEPSKKVG